MSPTACSSRGADCRTATRHRPSGPTSVGFRRTGGGRSLQAVAAAAFVAGAPGAVAVAVDVDAPAGVAAQAHVPGLALLAPEAAEAIRILLLQRRDVHGEA